MKEGASRYTWVEKWIAFGSWKSGRVLLELLFVLILLYIHETESMIRQFIDLNEVFLLQCTFYSSKRIKKPWDINYFLSIQTIYVFFIKKKYYTISKGILSKFDIVEILIFLDILIFIFNFVCKYIVIIFLSIFEVYSSTDIRVRELLIY